MYKTSNEEAKNLMCDVIQRVAVGPDRGRDIDLDEAQAVMQAVLNGQIDEVQIAVFFIALRMKRESLQECLGLFNAMQSNVETSVCDVEQLICLADPFDGYVRHVSMSPFLPAVLAACGLPTLIHGVESVGPKHGVTACKVYQLSGIETFHSAQDAANSIKQSGWAYLDQSQYAPKFFKLNNLRDQIVKRTALTTLERLLIPIKARGKTHLMLGYVHQAYPQIYAAVAKNAGYDSALLIKGVEGGLMPALNKPLRRYFFTREKSNKLDFNDANSVEEYKEVLEINEFSNISQAAQLVDKESEINMTELCLETGLAVLAGQKGIARDSLCLAAGQILFTHQYSDSMNNAVDQIRDVIDSGKGLVSFNKGS